MTTLKALGLEVPSGRLLANYGDLLRQQPPVQWQHGRRTPPGAPAHGAAVAPAPDQWQHGRCTPPGAPAQALAPDRPDQIDQPMVDRPDDHGGSAGLPESEPMDAGAENDQILMLRDGQGHQSSAEEHGQAMKNREPSGESGPSEEKANPLINAQCPG